MSSGNFQGITVMSGKVGAAGTFISFCAFLRWCGYRGWTKEEVRSLLDRLGVSLSDNTINAQWGSGSLERRGEKPHHGKAPNISQEATKALEAARRALSATQEAAQAVCLAMEDALEEGETFVLDDSDRRAIVERQIRERRGQQQFRNALRKRYGDACQITGCKVLAVLEAAHIIPYRGETDNHAENGLLLRSDIHTLFDLNLLGIEPLTLRVHISLDAMIEYGEFHGAQLKHKGPFPSEAALQSRFDYFRRTAAQSNR